MTLTELLNTNIAGNSAQQWLIALAIAATSLLFLTLLRALLLKRFQRFAVRSTNKWDDLAMELAREIRFSILTALALYIASFWLDFSRNVRSWINSFALIFLLTQIAFWGNTLVDFVLRRYQDQRIEDAGQVTTLKAVALLMKVALFSVLGILAIDNLPGVEITALIASLGIGGVAVALAVNNILGDLFASVSIAFDKPFVIGDFISVDEYRGTVEDIGLKTTRIRSADGEKIIFSNSDLLESRIRNYEDLSERRVSFTIGVGYGLPRQKLEKIPGILREAVESHPRTRFDRSHLKQLSTSTLDYETNYYVLDADYNLYMDIQQDINLRIIERFSGEGIDLAYPTRTIFVANGLEKPMMLPANSEGSSN